MRARRSGLATFLCIPVWLTASGALCDVEPLTLYQKTARAPLVVKARALSDSTRRPQVEVLHIYKGSCPSRIITILPHFEDNSSPTPWLRREVFRKDEESILFLSPYVESDGREGGPALFTVLNADQGKLKIPAEGAGALEAALEKIVSILVLGQHDVQGDALRRLLRERNPYLLEAGLAECAKFRLAVKEDIEPLLHVLGEPRPDFRAGALGLLAQVAEEAAAVYEPAAALDSSIATALMDHVAGAARLDSDESVRRRAIRVLEAIGGQTALALLDDIGKSDSSQNVRYDAQVSAYRLRLKAP